MTPSEGNSDSDEGDSRTEPGDTEEPAGDETGEVPGDGEEPAGDETGEVPGDGEEPAGDETGEVPHEGETPSDESLDEARETGERSSLTDTDASDEETTRSIPGTRAGSTADGSAEDAADLDAFEEYLVISELTGQVPDEDQPDLEKLEAATGDGDTGASEIQLLRDTPGPLSDPGAVRELIGMYGYVRGYFVAHSESYRDLQRSLNQARWGTTYDKYLTRLVYLTATVAVAAAAVGLLLGVTMAQLGLFAGLQSPVRLPGFVPQGLIDTVRARRVGIGILLVTTVVGLSGAVLTWAVGKLYPRYRANGRKRNINLVLPDAIVFMYALSESGMNLVDIIERMAESDDAYGDVSREFDMIHRDLELYGSDLYTSLRRARNLTPSQSFEQFLDDLLSLLDSGGDTTTFLEDQSRRHLESAKDEQEDLLTFLSLLSEVFMVGFVAAPLFVIVVLMVISLLGGAMVFEMTLFIYLALPLAFLAFGVLLSMLLDPYIEDAMTLRVEDRDYAQLVDEEASDTDDGSQFPVFRWIYRFRAVRRQLASPLSYFTDRPARTALVTGPLVLAYYGILALSGSLPLTVDAWTSDPVSTTNWVVVGPLLVLLVPVAAVHELDRRRRKQVTQRFPNSLNVLSSANSMGISLEDGISVVARTSRGYYARQLRILRADIRWSNDPSSALLRFANRIGVPALSRTLKLIAEGRRSTTDLSQVLRIAAEDNRNRFRLIRKRQQEMTSYVAVVIVSYLVFLGVILILDVSYLSPISELPEPEGAAGERAAGAPTAIDDVPLDQYRLLFYHAVIVQAIGTGLISGLLTDNSLKTGLKYCILLVLLALGAFTLL